jgi:hypothetical protein
MQATRIARGHRLAGLFDAGLFNAGRLARLAGLAGVSDRT